MSVFSYVTDLLSSVMESLSDAIILIMLLFEEEEATPEERGKEKIKNTVSLELNKNPAQGRYLGEQGVNAETSSRMYSTSAALLKPSCTMDLRVALAHTWQQETEFSP
ncbi:Mitochondrial import inner membrane translocase subunit Tim21 [Dissostichus eleginoides]|uniref:Mitochondrial import inner membrane translocase subunit Tim21 n=1 Tax=Dissostichus eleginoides TaxID=100907 RepID=A0AAD9C8F2_DISEL|nr:Mitochondrial import inner membrane translocase subunit Tim21 [Dissostichus eleginoides]